MLKRQLAAEPRLLTNFRLTKLNVLNERKPVELG